MLFLEVLLGLVGPENDATCPAMSGRRNGDAKVDLLFLGES